MPSSPGAPHGTFFTESVNTIHPKPSSRQVVGIAIADGLDHLDLFSYIGGFSGAGGMLVLGDRKLGPKTNGAFADPAAFAKKVHLLWLGVEQRNLRECAQDFSGCIHHYLRQAFSTSSMSHRTPIMNGRPGAAI